MLTPRLDTMNKRALIQKIVAKLTSELEVYFRAAQSSRAEASHEQNKPENKYDTRGNLKSPSSSSKSWTPANSPLEKASAWERWCNWRRARRLRFISSARAP